MTVRLPHLMAATAELGDKTVTVHDGNVIDAVPAVTGPHAVPLRPERDRMRASAVSTSPPLAGATKTMSHPAATVTGPQLLQAQANAVSARLKIKPP